MGSVRIDFLGNDEQIRRAADRAKTITEKAVVDAERASITAAGRGGGATDTAFAQRQAMYENRTAVYASRMTDPEQAMGLHEATGAFRRFLGTAGTVGAVAGTFYAIGQAIRTGVISWLETGTEKANRFKQSLDLSDVNASVSALTKQLDDVNSRLAESKQSVLASLLNAATGDTQSSLQKQSDEIQKTLANQQAALSAQEQRANEQRERSQKEAESKAREQRADAAREEQTRRVQDIDRAIASEYEKTLTGEERIKHEVESNIIEIDQQRAKASESERQRLDDLEQLIRQNGQRRIADVRREAQEQARAVEEAFGKTIDRIRSQSASLFPADRLEATVDNLTQKVDLIVQQLSRIPS